MKTEQDKSTVRLPAAIKRAFAGIVNLDDHGCW